MNLIDKYVAKAQRNKMPEKRGESNNVLIWSLRENAINNNTQQRRKSTNT